MSDNPYTILGVKKNASQKEIKAAYRKFAKELHPDINPGDIEAEERFKKISAAYNFLSDEDRRARFDRGEIDASGMEKQQQQFYRTYAGDDPRQQYYSTSGFSDFGSESDLFSELFGRAAGSARGRARHGPQQGADVQYQLNVDFLDAALGAKRRITMPDGVSLDITIPVGIKTGQKIRLKGKGMPGLNKGPNGNAYVKIDVFAHRVFRREGNDIQVELPITLDEAVLGGKIAVPTVHGKVTMNVPAGASTGQILRLKGKGITPRGKKAPGDQLVSLKIVMPRDIDEELKTFMQGWREKHAYSVRRDLEGAI